ncbi:unnamed protein product [Owenia fusiformis]|uniref:Uncharacterized protein n=1 Tax=Owenia fusiformis TaxID=6347 RepID=A0A8J1XTX8_OWEFU|nr:unnamed protein product [Owenia fusiformis]
MIKFFLILSMVYIYQMYEEISQEDKEFCPVECLHYCNITWHATGMCVPHDGEQLPCQRASAGKDGISGYENCFYDDEHVYACCYVNIVEYDHTEGVDSESA